MPAISAIGLRPHQKERTEPAGVQESGFRLQYVLFPFNTIDPFNDRYSVRDVENERSNAVAMREKTRVASIARMQAMLTIAASYG